MSALEEFIASHVGRMASPAVPDIGPGPYKIVRARHSMGRILLTLETPEGEREVKTEDCFIHGPKER